MLDGVELTMNREQLEALEDEVNSELESSSTSIAEPITDGVVDFDLYLASAPKILWILKEPVDEIENGVPSGGGWSLTQHVLAAGKFGDKRPFAPIAYIAYSVFNGFKKWAEIKNVSVDPQVKEAVKRIAYININKMPALATSGGTDLGSIYRKNRHLLRKQIDGMQPDVIIAGNILHLFYEDFGFNRQDLTETGLSEFCQRNGRLYINAYHPSYWVCDEETYVNNLVDIIKTHSAALPPVESPIENRQA